MHEVLKYERGRERKLQSHLVPNKPWTWLTGSSQTDTTLPPAWKSVHIRMGTLMSSGGKCHRNKVFLKFSSWNWDVTRWRGCQGTHFSCLSGYLLRRGLSWRRCKRGSNCIYQCCLQMDKMHYENVSSRNTFDDGSAFLHESFSFTETRQILLQIITLLMTLLWASSVSWPLHTLRIIRLHHPTFGAGGGFLSHWRLRWPFVRPPLMHSETLRRPRMQRGVWSSISP